MIVSAASLSACLHSHGSHWGPSACFGACSSSQRPFLQTTVAAFHIVSRLSLPSGPPQHTMQSGFSRRATRFTAGVMLAVWLMALGMGIANACLANDDHARHGHLDHQDGTSASAPATGHDAMPADQTTANAHPGSGDSSPPSPDKVTCQNFCAAGQSSLLQQPADEPGTVITAPMLATSWWPNLPPSDHRVLWSVQVDPAGSQPSPPFRFLRLTI